MTADAFIVNLINQNGDVTRYLQCKVIGKSIEKAKMLLKSGEKFELTKVVEGTESVFVLDENGINSLKSEAFPENDDAKFYLELDENTEVKLSDVNDDKVIGNLKNEIDYNQGSHLVKWSAIDEDDIYYYVEILNAEGRSVFRSQSLSANANQDMQIEINRTVDSVFESLDDLEVNEQCVVRIIGVKYEDDINPSTSKYEDYNVQAKTIFSYGILWS